MTNNTSTAGWVEIYIDQGSTYLNTIVLEDDVTNAKINVDGYYFSSQLRRSYNSANASANLLCTITDAQNGVVALSMTSANTTNLKAGRYFFDVRMIDKGGVKSKIVEGTVTVNPSVTRD
jgi:hypothetical protein